jgi:hypothetical protein
MLFISESLRDMTFIHHLNAETMPQLAANLLSL